MNKFPGDTTDPRLAFLIWRANMKSIWFQSDLASLRQLAELQLQKAREMAASMGVPTP